MATNVQDHVVDLRDVRRDDTARLQTPERPMFRAMEQMARPSDISERKQRVAAVVVAVIICAALYTVLYLAMHFQQ